MHQQQETAALAPKPIPGPPAIKHDGLLEALPARLTEQADTILEDLSSWWRETAGVAVSTATMSRTITAFVWMRKITRTAILT